LAEIACSTISQVLVQAMLGGGLAKAGLLIAARVIGLKKAITALAAFSKMQKLNPDANAPKDLTQKVLACMR
jgi:hypothetical protein